MDRHLWLDEVRSVACTDWGCLCLLLGLLLSLQLIQVLPLVQRSARALPASCFALNAV
jgi:hypothetical protein